MAHLSLTLGLSLTMFKGGIRALRRNQMGSWVIHVFQKKLTHGIKMPQREVDLIQGPFEEAEDVAMKKEKVRWCAESDMCFAISDTRTRMLRSSRRSWRQNHQGTQPGLSVLAAHDRMGIAEARAFFLRLLLTHFGQSIHRYPDANR